MKYAIHFQFINLDLKVKRAHRGCIKSLVPRVLQVSQTRIDIRAHIFVEKKKNPEYIKL